MRILLHNMMSTSDAPTAITTLGGYPIASSRTWLEELSGIETSEMTDDEIDEIRPLAYLWAGSQPGVTYHKVHDAFGLTPSGTPMFPKTGCLGVVYIVRNPLDIVSSLANHLQCSTDDAITILNDPSQIWSVTTDTLAIQCRQKILDWSGHVRSWEESGIAVLIVRYEDMLRTPIPTLSRVIDFLGLGGQRERLPKAIENSRFSLLQQQERAHNFPEKPDIAINFFRQGISGAWRHELTNIQVSTILDRHEETMRKLGYWPPDAHWP